MKTFFTLVILGAALFWDGDPDKVLGRWHTPEDKSIIEIFKCDDRYCGKIVDLKEKVYPDDDGRGMAGTPKVDRDNPDEKLRKRPIIGLELMSGFSFNGSSWTGGTIYDPESGKTYKCKMRIREDGALVVRGYVGISLIGRTSVWQRPPAEEP